MLKFEIRTTNPRCAFLSSGRWPPRANSSVNRQEPDHFCDFIKSQIRGHMLSETGLPGKRRSGYSVTWFDSRQSSELWGRSSGVSLGVYLPGSTSDKHLNSLGLSFWLGSSKGNPRDINKHRVLFTSWYIPGDLTLCQRRCGLQKDKRKGEIVTHL